jgi:hypothetical protein
VRAQKTAPKGFAPKKGAKRYVARDFVCLTFITSKEKLVNGRLICTAMGYRFVVWSIEAKYLFPRQTFIYPSKKVSHFSLL